MTGTIRCERHLLPLPAEHSEAPQASYPREKPGCRRQRAGRKAWAALAWGIGLFLLFQVGLAFAIEHIFPEIGNPAFAVKVARLRRLFQGTPAPELLPEKPALILMLGSSRTAYGLNAAHLEQELTGELRQPLRVFNFGTLGAGPITELLWLHQLLHQGITPDLLLVEVLPPFLAGQLSDPAEARYLSVENRLGESELRLLERYHFSTEQRRQAQRLSWLVPGYAHRAALLGRLVPSWLPYHGRQDWAWSGDAHGWNRQDAPLPPDCYTDTVRSDRAHYTAAFTGFRRRGPDGGAARTTGPVSHAAHPCGPRPHAGGE